MALPAGFMPGHLATKFENQMKPLRKEVQMIFLTRIRKLASVPGVGWLSLTRAVISSCLMWLALSVSAQSTTPASPSPGASCVVTAQNRTAPLSGGDNYVIPNLPSIGLVPFGTGGSAQPFRVRATCDDGTVGETALAFPELEQKVVRPGSIAWGQNTPVPARVTLHLPSTSIDEGGTMQAVVKTIAADDSMVNATNRASGTGYRSSASWAVGVGPDGEVFIQPAWRLISDAVGLGGAPPRVVITAENDGVTASRVLDLLTPRTVSGRVLLPDGSPAPAGMPVRLDLSEQWSREVLTSSDGSYAFSPLPWGTLSGRLSALDIDGRRFGAQSVFFYSGTVLNQDIQLGGVGNVQIKVLDQNDAPVANIETSFVDAVRRELPTALTPLLRTDAMGVALFTNVASGHVAPLVAAGGLSSTPTYASLAAGGTAEFIVRVSSAGASSISGTVTWGYPAQPMVGAVVQLQRSSGLTNRADQIVAQTGRFKFDDLVPSDQYVLTVYHSGLALFPQQLVSTGPSGSTSPADFHFSSFARVVGTIYRRDGVTPANGTTVQLSQSVIGTWKFMKSSTVGAGGEYGFGPLLAGRYRLDAVAPDGDVTSVEVPVDDASGVITRDIVLGASTQPSTIVSIRATVMGGSSWESFAAQVWVTNSSCVTSCLVGGIGSTNDRFSSDLLPQGLNTFDVVWKGRRQSFQVTVNASTDGQTIERAVDFSADETGVLTFVEQRSVYSLTAEAGELIDAIVVGNGVGPTSGAYAVKVELFGPDNALIGEGYGFDSTRVNPSDSGVIRAFAAPASGAYTVIVSPYYLDRPQDLGGYSLLVNVADAKRALERWSAAGGSRLGGAVSGSVRRANGEPVAGQVVRISAGQASGLRLVEEVTAQGDGSYRHDNLPLGVVEAKVLELGAPLASGTATLAALGEATIIDLVLKRATKLNLTVRRSSFFANVFDVNPTIRDGGGERSVGRMHFEDGATITPVKVVIAVGDTAHIRVSHPDNVVYYVEKTISATEGPEQDVELALTTGQVTGQVLDNNRVPIPGVLVQASGDLGQALDATYTDSRGTYLMGALPGGVRVNITAIGIGVRASAVVETQADQIVSAVDLLLSYGGIRGRVLNGDLTPAVGLPVEVTLPDSSTVRSVTDSNGLYEFATLPVDQVLTVRVTRTGTSLQATGAVTARTGVVTDVPDLVFLNGARVTGRVRTPSGQAIANAPVMLSNQTAVAACAPQDLPGPGPSLFTLQTTTDSAGNYAFPDVPREGALVASAANGSLTCSVLTQPLTLEAATPETIVPDFVFDNSGASLRLQIADGMGAPVYFPDYGGECPYYILVNGPGVSRVRLPLPPLEGALYDSVALGNYTAELRGICAGDTAIPEGSGAVNVSGGGETPLKVVMSMLRGKIVYADGTAPSSGSISVTQIDADGNRQVRYGEFTDAAQPNAFTLYGLGSGDYEIQASDYEFGISMTQTGTFTAPVGGTRDLVLEPSAKLKGCVKSFVGNDVLVPSMVTVWNTTQPSWSGTYRVNASAANGCYEFQRVPNGYTVASAESDAEGGLDVATLDIAVSVDNTEVVKDFQYQVKGFMRVLVTDVGGNPLASRRVYVQSQQLEPPLAAFSAEGTTDPTGFATFTLHPGTYSVNVWNRNDASERIGATSVQVAAAQSTEVTVADAGRYLLLKDPSKLYRDALATSDDLRFMLGYDNGMFSSGLSNYFNFYAGPRLYVNGMSPFVSISADFPPGAREVKVGPYAVGASLQISRRMFVPVAGGYARLVDSIANTSDTAVRVLVESINTERKSCPPLSITQPQNSSSRGYVAFEDCEAALGHVYAGPTGAAQPSRVDVQSQRGGVTQWTLTIPPGQTSSIMHFYVLKGLGGLADVKTKAAELVNQSEASMLDGLSTMDRQSIRNFNVSP